MTAASAKHNRAASYNSRTKKQSAASYCEIAGCCRCGFAGQVAGTVRAGGGGLLAGCVTAACWYEPLLDDCWATDTDWASDVGVRLTTELMTDVSPVVQVPHPLSIDHSAHGCNTTHKLLSTTMQQLFNTFLQVFLCANNEATYTTKKETIYSCPCTWPDRLNYEIICTTILNSML